MEHYIQNNDLSLFENAFTYATIGKALVALDGLFLRINRSFCRMVGYSEEEILNKTFQDITHPDDLRMDLDYIRQLIRGELDSYQMEKRYFHKLGHVVWVLLSVSLVRDEHKEPLFFIAQVQDISERKRVARELQSERDKFESIINGTADAITMVNVDGRVLQVNPAYERLFGWHPDEVVTKFPPAIPGSYRAEFYEVLERVKAGESVVGWETVRQRRDGTMVDVSLTVSPILDDIGVISMIVAIARDITEIKKSQRRARLATQVYQSITDGVIVTDEKSTIVSINSAFTDITGFAEAEVLGKKPFALIFGQDDKGFYEEVRKTLKSAGKWKGEVINKKKNGESFVEEISVTEVRDGNGNIINYVGIVADITERRHLEDETRHQAYHDPLTGLANRRLFAERLTEAITLAESQQHMTAVIFLDLDYFKLINDSLGHHQGDQVLRMVAERLTRCVGEHKTVSRLGGDEFNILLPHVNSPEDAAKVAGEILETLRQPFVLQGSEYFITASIGISMFPDDARDEETLVRNADTAMYLAKKQRGNIRFFSSTI